MQRARFMFRRVVRRSRRWLAPALLVVFLTPLAAGCGNEGSTTSPLPPASTPPPASVRDRLTLADLFGSSPPGVGNHVLMLPSGLSMVRFMDADNMEVRNATRAAGMYRGSCR